jgi:AAA+ superfamily predicted ATPase
MHYLRRLGPAGGEELRRILEQYPFMARYCEDMLRYMPEEISWEEGLQWWATEVVTWESASPIHLPLVAMHHHAELDFASRLAFIMVGLVEEDSRFGTLFAQLQAPLASRRPCAELVGQIMLDHNASDTPDVWRVCRPLLANSLVEVANHDAPRSEWVLRVPALLWQAVRGEVEPHPAPWCQYHPPEAFPAIDDLILPQEFCARLGQVPTLVTVEKAHTIILRGMQGSERLQMLGAVARALGQGVIEVTFVPATVEGSERPWSLLGPLCAMTHALPMLTYDLGPGETSDVPLLSGYQGCVGVLMGFEGGLSGPGVARAITLTVPFPTVAQRRRYWQAALSGHTVEELAAISERFHLPGGYIRQVGAIALAHAALEQRQEIRLADVREACRTLHRQLLDTLATRLEVEGTWDSLVVSDAIMAKLLELEQRCQHRERLLAHLGPAFGTASNRGVRALFTGASGTGKTLAAKILAAELGMDLYRVDLAAVVNKYIGETEKNMHRVLSRAEELDVILLLDEGDALLSNRTDVKSANDRYANLETNYLLQRLEHYQGIVVVTTNAGQYIDTAFQRRMDVVVHFVPPQAQERLHIWQLHLPATHAVDWAYLEEVAVRCSLTGGQIRNAALHAILLAVHDGSHVVNRMHLEQAMRSEYRKAGAICPLRDHGERRIAHGGMAAFVDAFMA